MKPEIVKQEYFALMENFLSITRDNSVAFKEMRDDFDRRMTDIKDIVSMLRAEVEKLSSYIEASKGDHDKLITVEFLIQQGIKDSDALHEKHRNFEKELRNLNEWKIKIAVYISGVSFIVSILTAIILRKIFQ
uniref:Uncharacterized protein n=1 Tax=viral metagenome TaxID=1070528 RepID=A0A6H2A232_9ZZZZ